MLSPETFLLFLMVASVTAIVVLRCYNFWSKPSPKSSDPEEPIHVPPFETMLLSDVDASLIHILSPRNKTYQYKRYTCPYQVFPVVYGESEKPLVVIFEPDSMKFINSSSHEDRIGCAQLRLTPFQIEKFIEVFKRIGYLAESMGTPIRSPKCFTISSSRFEAECMKRFGHLYSSLHKDKKILRRHKNKKDLNVKLHISHIFHGAACTHCIRFLLEW